MIDGTTGFVSLRLVVPRATPGFRQGRRCSSVCASTAARGSRSRSPGSVRSRAQVAGPEQGAGRWTALGFAVAPELAGSPAVADALLFSVPLLPPVWSSDTAAGRWRLRSSSWASPTSGEAQARSPGLTAPD